MKLMENLTIKLSSIKSNRIRYIIPYDIKIYIKKSWQHEGSEYNMMKCNLVSKYIKDFHKLRQ